MIIKRGILRLVLFWAIATLPTQVFPAMTTTSVKERPNIILMMADDMGYRDISSFGATAVKTPNIDRLASDGMRFTSFYSASAVCSPTRVSVLTGRYPLRFDVRQQFDDESMYLPEYAGSIAKLLRDSGYATIHIGKWHLGGLHVGMDGRRLNNQPGPHQHGFDFYQSQIEQQPLRRAMGKEKTIYRKGGTVLLRNDEPVGPDDPYYDMHLTDANGEYALEMIEKVVESDQPFFLNLWWLVPHTPYEPAPEPHWSETREEGISFDQHAFRSMMQHMDARVGLILDKLDELGIAENTIVIFTSDNGAAFEGDIGDLKGGKTDLHEGGIRVPMMVRWPDKVPAGITTGALSHTIDLLPTLCDAANIQMPRDFPVDGISLLPLMTGQLNESTWDRGAMFWQMSLYLEIQRHHEKPKPYATEIARQGQWKLLSMEGKPVALYDVDNDPNELSNLLTVYPAVADLLGQQVRGWLAEPRERIMATPKVVGAGTIEEDQK